MNVQVSQKESGKTARKRPPRKPVNNLGERSICASDIKRFLLCQLSYRLAKEGAQTAELREEQMVGNLTHDGSAESNPQDRERLLQQGLAELEVSDEKKVEVESKVRALIQVADELEDEEAFDVRREKLVRWLDEETGWELVAKPDEVSTVLGERGSEIIQVVDKKTGGRLLRSHKDQIFFFGLVIYLSRREDFFGSIKLIVRLLGNQENPDREFWFSRAKVDSDLNKVRQVIRQIESALEKNRFKPTVGDHCERCSVRGACRAYDRWKSGEFDQVASFPPASRQRVKAPQFGGGRKKTA